AADHDNVVEPRRVAEILPGRHFNAAARPDGLCVCAENAPANVYLTTEIALVPGQAPAVDEGGERQHRELRQQNEADRQLGCVAASGWAEPAARSCSGYHDGLSSPARACCESRALTAHQALWLVAIVQVDAM